MLKNKKSLLILLCMVLTLSFLLAACGEEQTGPTADGQEDPNTCPTDPYEISWYFTNGDPQDDTEAVEAAINEYLKPKINATVKLVRLSGGQYTEKMNAKINAGEKYDICFTANWSLSYKTTASKGAWVALDEYFDKYMPNIKKEIGMDILDNARGLDGKIYAIPALKEMAEQRGWGFRKDIVEKYDIDMSQYVYTENNEFYKSFELIKPLLKEIKEKEPVELQYPIDWDTSRTPGCFGNFDSLISPVGIFEHKEVGKVINSYETTEHKESARIAREFFQEGLIKKDVLTATDFNARLKEGKIFAYAEFLKPGKTDELSENYVHKLGQIGVTTITASNGVGVGSMMAVSQTSDNPVRAMRFLELFNSDKTLNNLVIYGIENKHYRKLPEKGPDYIEVIKDGGYTLAGAQWSMGNVFLNYLTANEAPDKVAKLKEFNQSAVKPQHYGFILDQTPIQKEAAALKTVGDEFNKQIALGAQDYLPILALRDEKLKVAGIDVVMKEVQRQYDEFRASKGLN